MRQCGDNSTLTPPANRLEPREIKMANENQNSNMLPLILAWGFVGIPLAWGVIQTLQNAMKLFQ